MKKLNITKKQYDESKYFTNKYGAIKFVSESGKHYKTDKGVVLALESEIKKEDGDESIIDRLTDDKEDKGGAEGDVTRGELTDILKDVVAEVEKVCDAQDISFEEVAGVEKPEGESDEEADKDEVVATKEEVAEVLSGVIDTVEKVADKNDIELPEKDDDDDKEDDEKEDKEDKEDKEGTTDECTVTEGDDKCGDKLAQIRKILMSDELSADAMVSEIGELVGSDVEEETCPECGTSMKKECGDKTMESRKARAKMIREAIARRAKALKLRESCARRAKIRKVLESIRRKRVAKKVLESIRRRRAMKKTMESSKTPMKGFRPIKARMAK